MSRTLTTTSRMNVTTHAGDRADGANPDNEDAGAQAERAGANVCAVRQPDRSAYARAGGAHRGNAGAHAPAARGDVHARAARQDVAKVPRPSDRRQQEAA